ncbi:MAG: serine/threonine protein phosphatase [Myxococcota bacterium]|jgi:uncharacterized tellurite resistance protein B-like protein|nr:serine/threonine protein phosphatase [Myxococcota bacterium]
MLTFDKDAAVAEKQMHAIIYSLATFGYIDGDFARSEKDYIRTFIAKLVEKRAQDAIGSDLSAHGSIVKKWTAHFHEVLDSIDSEIRSLFSESVAEGEDTMQFVLARLKLRSFEIFRRFDENMRLGLLETVEELIQADGTVQENEQKFRDELFALLREPVELDEVEIEPIPEGAVVVGKTQKIPIKSFDHPFLRSSEWNYAADPSVFARQAQSDVALIEKFCAEIDRHRALGKGALGGVQKFSDLQATEPLLDGHVCYLQPQEKVSYEILVLGDLHGCYSCLKAALLQVDFFAKVQAHHDDPKHNPKMLAVFLGDYIDRGRFSYNGILRTVMQLYLAAPGSVIPLRGNHEYYVQVHGRVLAPVQPSEAMNALRNIAPEALFTQYMRLFETLPNIMVFDKTIFVHAGIPRDDTFAEKYRDLSSLNDEDISFQMRWSDPSEVNAVPLSLQQANARFPFGVQQFKRFMSRIGCSTMIRGHERFIEGMRTIYDEPEAVLLSLFSAGGVDNQDLPLESNYREVRPMALTIKYESGVSKLTPFVIEYEKFNDPKYNAFFPERLG